MKFIKSIAIVLLASTCASFGIGNIKSDEVFARDFGSPSYATFTNALNAIGDAEKTLVIDGGEWTITSDVVVPSNVSLDVRTGSYFSGAGQITGLSYARPEWWGAIVDDDVDDASAITSAIIAGKEISFSTGAYLLDSGVTVFVDHAVALTGHDSLLYADTAFDGGLLSVYVTSSVSSVTVDSMTFDGGGVVPRGMLVSMYGDGEASLISLTRNILNDFESGIYTNTSAQGIIVSGVAGSTVDISYNTVSDIAMSIGAVDGVTSARGIGVTGVTTGSISICNNSITDVFANGDAGGDAIIVFDEDAITDTDKRNNVIISQNTIKEAGGRFVKLQVIDALISDNFFETTGYVMSAPIDAQVGGARVDRNFFRVGTASDDLRFLCNFTSQDYSINNPVCSMNNNTIYLYGGVYTLLLMGQQAVLTNSSVELSVNGNTVVNDNTNRLQSIVEVYPNSLCSTELLVKDNTAKLYDLGSAASIVRFRSEALTNASVAQAIGSNTYFEIVDNIVEGSFESYVYSVYASTNGVMAFDNFVIRNNSGVYADISNIYDLDPTALPNGNLFYYIGGTYPLKNIVTTFDTDVLVDTTSELILRLNSYYGRECFYQRRITDDAYGDYFINAKVVSTSTNVFNTQAGTAGSIVVDYPLIYMSSIAGTNSWDVINNSGTTTTNAITDEIPSYVGEEVYSSHDSIWYKAHGLNTNDWDALN